MRSLVEVLEIALAETLSVDDAQYYRHNVFSYTCWAVCAAAEEDYAQRDAAK
jgi:hypothetical protein